MQGLPLQTMMSRGYGCGGGPRRALMASGQVTMRRVDGWQTLDQAPADSPLDLAA